jgi:hypothetical protein
LIVGAHETKLSGKETAGKSYVVFGKKDSTAIDLSAIASGTGGFVINGEHAGDWSGISVSTAGDVNGDGLDDLIIGIKSSKPSPLTSPALETEIPLLSLVLLEPIQAINQLQVNLMLSLVQPTTQQLTFLLLPVAQRKVNCCAVGFTEDNIRFSFFCFIT